MKGVPYVDLAAQAAPLREALLAAAGRVFAHGKYILGPEVEELEGRLAAKLGVRHVVGVNSGTDALLLGLRLCGIGSGDEVLTVSHSFFATATAVRLLGARPVFVDVDPETMLLDPDRLDGATTPRTRAVMPVHLNGYPCDMDRIAEFCERRGLALIEDCAQSFGARFAGRATGAFGIGCFSLHPLKVLSACGDAGFVTVDSDAAAERLRHLRNIGLRDRDHCSEVSGNSRLDTLQAALLLVKLDQFDSWVAARRAHVEAYRTALTGRFTLPPEEDERHEAIWSAFVIRHPERDRLREALAVAGIECKVHYPIPIHRQEAFADLAPFPPLPQTDRVVATMLSLPVTPELSAADRSRVVDALVVASKAIGGVA